jgi:SH3-like domain-containing protein
MKRISLLVLLVLVGMACGLSAPSPTIAPTIAPTSLPTLSPTPLWTSTPAFTPTASLTPTEIVSFTPSPPMVEAVSHTVNCRFGPGEDYLPVGTLPPGQWVPINATIKDHSWWRIKLPSSSGTVCWVGNSLTETRGDLSQVNVVRPSGGFAIGATVSADTARLVGPCSGPNTNHFNGTITSNGPSEILYVWEIADSAGNRLVKTSTMSLVFHTQGTLAVNSWSYTDGCGTYVVSLVVFNPNSLVATFSYQAGP